MKKLLTLMLAAALTLSLAACGSGDKAKSKEELLEEAVELDWQTIAMEIAKNQVAAKKDYEGTICILSGYIDGIYNEDYIELNWYSEVNGVNALFPADWGTSNEMFHAKSALRMDLDDDDAAKVHEGDYVTVIGKLENVMVNGTELKNAYLIEE